jgi:hypothetical protein
MSRYDAWSEERVAAYLARFNSAPLSAPDPQPNEQLKIPRSPQGQKVHSRYRVKVHSRRRRLADPDGIDAKSAIDGLCRGGILADDSAEYCDAPEYTQEKAIYEETIIELWEMRAEK